MQYVHPLMTREVSQNGYENFEVSSYSQTSKNFSLLFQNQSTAQKEKRKKITHISFLKVHKASSTTMQNIFFRFGLKNNLNILLPKTGNYLWKKADQMKIKQPKHYDLFAIHTIYRKSLFDSLLPSDSVKIGIVREPIDRMISAAYYYRDVWHNPYLIRIPRSGFIHNLVKFPERYEPSFFTNTRNTMARDFGLSRKIRQTDTQLIKNILERLNSQFLLVLSVEKFDESLVLMKRLLGWDISEILYVTKNKHKHTPTVLSPYEKSKFRKTSFLDFKIYDYFTKVLDEKLNRMPSEFWDEVAYLKTLLKNVKQFCSESNKDQKVVITQTNWNEPFTISKNDCKLMSTNELSFIGKLRGRHRRINQ